MRFHLRLYSRTTCVSDFVSTHSRLYKSTTYLGGGKGVKGRRKVKDWVNLGNTCIQSENAAELPLKNICDF